MPGEHRDLYVSTTLSIVIFTTVVCGGLTAPLLSTMGLAVANGVQPAHEKFVPREFSGGGGGGGGGGSTVTSAGAATSSVVAGLLTILGDGSSSSSSADCNIEVLLLLLSLLLDWGHFSVLVLFQRRVRVGDILVFLFRLAGRI